MIRLEQPEFLLLILFIPLFFIFKKLGFFTKIAFPLTFSDWQGKSFVWKNSIHFFARFLIRFFCVVGLLALIVALANPEKVYQKKVFVSQGNEIIFVLDVSPSMAALDIGTGSRLDAAKKSISKLVEATPETAFGLVALGSESALLVPPTMDHGTFLNRLSNLVIGQLGDGTALGLGIATAVLHLDTSLSRKRIVVLITDGENNGGDIHPVTSAKLAQKKGVKIYTLGVGTFGSVPIEYTDFQTGKVYSGYLDSQFNDSSLKEICALSGGKYFSIENQEIFMSSLSQIEKTEEVAQTFYLREEIISYSFYCVLLGAVLFLLAWILSRLYLKEFL